ncbi:MAG TPA: molybdopterin converting factor subunit 1 [Kiloniellales bacterium]|nr:molybdopterin converting factor subunit 1 [Kiloniellales bacterium]
MRLLYFAWVRTKVGKGSEELDPPATVEDVAGLLAWLKQQSPRHADALADLARLRVAVNQDYVTFDHPVKPGDEIAIFPPVTGG